MNVLDKIKIVQRGLAECGSDCSMCSKCPYYDRDMCRKGLIREANEVINALRDELKKRTNKAVETKPGLIFQSGKEKNKFVVLTVDSMDYENQKIAVKIDNINYMFDTDAGSNILLNDDDLRPIRVKEKLEEILEKIAEVKGEEE